MKGFKILILCFMIVSLSLNVYLMFFQNSSIELNDAKSKIEYYINENEQLKNMIEPIDEKAILKVNEDFLQVLYGQYTNNLELKVSKMSHYMTTQALQTYKENINYDEMIQHQTSDDISSFTMSYDRSQMESYFKQDESNDKLFYVYSTSNVYLNSTLPNKEGNLVENRTSFELITKFKIIKTNDNEYKIDEIMRNDVVTTSQQQF